MCGCMRVRKLSFIQNPNIVPFKPRAPSPLKLRLVQFAPGPPCRLRPWRQGACRSSGFLDFQGVGVTGVRFGVFRFRAFVDQASGVFCHVSGRAPKHLLRTCSIGTWTLGVPQNSAPTHLTLKTASPDPRALTARSPKAGETLKSRPVELPCPGPL